MSFNPGQCDLFWQIITDYSADRAINLTRRELYTNTVHLKSDNLKATANSSGCA
jgi:hypothetical protein